MKKIGITLITLGIILITTIFHLALNCQLEGPQAFYGLLTGTSLYCIGGAILIRKYIIDK